MCILLETKLNSRSLDLFLNKWFSGWGSFYNLDAHPRDRIAILWRKDLFNVTTSFVSEQLVHCKVNILGRPYPFDFSTVYGLYTVPNRRVL